MYVINAMLPDITQFLKKVCLLDIHHRHCLMPLRVGTANGKLYSEPNNCIAS